MMSAPIKEIDGQKFALGVIPAADALRLQPRLLKMFGPALKALATPEMVQLYVAAKNDKVGKPSTEADAKQAEDAAQAKLMVAMQKLGLSALADGIAGMADNIDPDELVKVHETVLKSVSAGGNMSLTLEYFNGKPELLWQVFGAALMENFGGFFRGVLSRLGQGQGTA